MLAPSCAVRWQLTKQRLVVSARGAAAARPSSPTGGGTVTRSAITQPPLLGATPPRPVLTRAVPTASQRARGAAHVDAQAHLVAAHVGQQLVLLAELALQRRDEVVAALAHAADYVERLLAQRRLRSSPFCSCRPRRCRRRRRRRRRRPRRLLSSLVARSALGEPRQAGGARARPRAAGPRRAARREQPRPCAQRRAGVRPPRRSPRPSRRRSAPPRSPRARRRAPSRRRDPAAEERGVPVGLARVERGRLVVVHESALEQRFLVAGAEFSSSRPASLSRRLASPSAAGASSSSESTPSSSRSIIAASTLRRRPRRPRRRPSWPSRSIGAVAGPCRRLARRARAARARSPSSRACCGSAAPRAGRGRALRRSPS